MARYTIDTILACLVFAFLYVSSGVHASEGNLVLWNKHGSEQEVLTSEVGENGALVGEYAFEPARIATGLSRKT